MASSMASMVAAIHASTATALADTSLGYQSTSSSPLPYQQPYQQPQQQQQQQQQQLASNTSLIEAAAECTPEIKTEFYTREGIWRLVHSSGEYARQIVVSHQQQFQPPPVQHQQPAAVTIGAGPTPSLQAAGSTASGQVTPQNGSTTNLNGSPVVVNITQVPTTVTSNEPVQAKLFRFSKRLLIQDSFLHGADLEHLPRQHRHRRGNNNNNGAAMRLCRKCVVSERAAAAAATTARTGSIVVRDVTAAIAHDDDDDVVYTKLNNININGGDGSGQVKFTLHDSSTQQEQQRQQRSSSLSGCCSKCGQTSTNLIECTRRGGGGGGGDDDVGDDESESITSSINSSPHLDVLVFNYSKEIYTYEFNKPVTSTSKSGANNIGGGTGVSDASKNLIDKKIYKTYVSTCVDINLIASTVNTKVLQLMYNSSAVAVSTQQQQQQQQYQSPIIMSPVTAGTSGVATTSTTKAAPPNISSTSPKEMLNENFKFSLSPSNLSLIVAAGFNKGEIHVFDVFKKDASIFYNNSKLVDKTKVTCIKWLPNSVNLFLVGYSSGNIYLYDANIQAQATVAPTYTKYIQTDAYSVFLNSSSSDQAASSSGIGSQASTASQAANPNAPASSNVGFNRGQQPQQPIYNVLLNQPQKLLQLSSSNSSQPVQVAKNPLARIKIGECPANMPQHHHHQAQQQSGNSNSSGGSSAGGGSSGDPSSWELSGLGVNEFAFSPCGQYLAVVSQDGYLRIFYFVYDTSTTTTTTPLQIQLRCSMKSYFGGLLCVCWSHDGRYVATGGEDDLITVFAFAAAADSMTMRVACRGRGHSSWINALAFDPWTVLPTYGAMPSSLTFDEQVFIDDDGADDTNPTREDANKSKDNQKLNRPKNKRTGHY